MARKKTAGLYLAVITAVLCIVGLIAYMINTGTNYYAKMGVDTNVVICLVCGIVLTALYIILGMKGTSVVYDLLAICSAVVTMVGLVLMANVRINNLAAVFTFENSAANMADTTSCIVALAATLLAVIFGIVTAFFDVTKE